MQSLAVGRGLPQLRQPKALSFCRVTGRSPLGVRCSSISVHASGDPEAPRSVRQNEKLLKQLAAAGATVACGLCVAKLFISSHQPALANDAVRSAPSASITYSTPPPAPGPGQWLSYKLMQVFTLPVYGKLLAMVAVGAPLVLLGAIAYRRTTGSDWGEAMSKTYYVLNNAPGADITGEDSPNASLVLNLVHVASLFTFAILVGVLTEEIQSGVEAVRAGNFPLPESGHTVLLGWGARTPTVLREILEAQRERGSGCGLRAPVVLLGDEATKEEMDEALMDAGFTEVLGTTLITRHGSPTRPADLERVAAGRASTVVWMVPPGDGASEGEEDGGGGNADGNTSAGPGARAGALAASLAALHSIADPSVAHGAVIVQADESLHGWEDTPAGRTVGRLLAARGRHITTLAEFTNLDNILAQAALSPGLSSVFEKICLQGTSGVEFYTRSAPELAGRTFRSVRRAFDAGVVCGVVDGKSGKTVLAPPDEYVLTPRDHVVMLAADPHHTHLNTRTLVAETAKETATSATLSDLDLHAADRTAVAALAAKAKAAQLGARIVVLAPGGGAAELLVDSLCEYAPRGSLITLVTPSCDGRLGSSSPEGAALRKGPGASKGIRLRVVRDDPAAPSALRAAGVVGADAVVLQPPAGWSPADEDANVISTALALRGLLEEQQPASTGSTTGSTAGSTGSTDPLNFVCCVREEQSRGVLNQLVPKVEHGNHTATATAATANDQALLPRSLHLDVVLADDLLSGMLTQVAAEPLLQGTFQDLCEEEGVELYVRDPAATYGLPVGTQLRWSEVQEVVRGAHTVAAGYIDRWGDVVLGLPADSVITLQAGERLIVLAED